MNISLETTPYYATSQLHTEADGHLHASAVQESESQTVDDRFIPHIPGQNGKRKQDDEDSMLLASQRPKRNRYISIACNECKRRKIKCNGLSPCHRCGNLSLDCVYAPNCCASAFRDSEEYRNMSAQIQSLQQQIDNIYAHLSAMRGDHHVEASHESLQPDDSSIPYRADSISSPSQAKLDPPPPSLQTAAMDAHDVQQASQDLAAQLLKAAHG